MAAELDAMIADYSGWHWTHESSAKGLEPPAVDQLNEMRMPALVITGGRDLGYNHAVRDAVLARVSHAKVLDLPRGGHIANMERS